MSQGDRDKWNRIYAGREVGGDEVDPFLRAAARSLPSAGRALDVAGGAGRHAVWLARRGLEVTVVDVSEVGLEQARERARSRGLAIATVTADLEDEPLPAGPWDVIVSFHHLQRSLFPAFARELAPGGLLVFCQPTRTNLERHARPSARFLLADDELPELLRGLPFEVLEYREDWSETGRHEAHLIARRLS